MRRTGIERSPDDRLVSGLAAGIAARLGIGSSYVRAAFVVLAFAGLVGAFLYVAAWVMTVDSVATDESEDEYRRATSQQQLALALILLGVLLGLRSVGLWFGDSVVWPVALVTFGVAVSWDRSGSGRDRNLFERLTSPGGQNGPEPSRRRIAAGAILMLGGLIVFFSTVSSLANLGAVMAAVLITAAGFMLVFGPWVWRLAGDLTRERRERIRSEERAEMAAHLHDSVLQTLALIQRTEDPKRMVTLARAQERELRSWLFGRAPLAGTDLLSTAIEAAAAKVETDHDVPIEVVTVGDCPVDDRIEALALASREAMTNAARHSESDRVSVYVEVNEDQVDAWISDQGDGFELGEVPADRRGISDSIVGRMERNGGTAEISSDAVDGTEVHLWIKREPS
ncbi:MAG: PspC domain-containing protein [Acidimicrobiia bacterium]